MNPNSARDLEEFEFFKRQEEVAERKHARNHGGATFLICVLVAAVVLVVLRIFGVC